MSVLIIIKRKVGYNFKMICNFFFLKKYKTFFEFIHRRESRYFLPLWTDEEIPDLPLV